MLLLEGKKKGKWDHAGSNRLWRNIRDNDEDDKDNNDEINQTYCTLNQD